MANQICGGNDSVDLRRYHSLAGKWLVFLRLPVCGERAGTGWPEGKSRGGGPARSGFVELGWDGRSRTDNQNRLSFLILRRPGRE